MPEKTPDPRSLRPGRLFAAEGRHGLPRHDGAVVLRRELLGSRGTKVLDVFERTCGSVAEAEAYVAQFGSPAKCPPPYGQGEPVPPGWTGKRRYRKRQRTQQAAG